VILSRLVVGAVALALLALFARPAAAHTRSTGFLEVKVVDRQVQLQLDLLDLDLDEPAKLDANADKSIDEAEVQAARPRIAAYLLERLAVKLGDVKCPGKLVDARLFTRLDRRYVRSRLEMTCPRRIDEATLHYGVFFELDASHSGLARIETSGLGRRSLWSGDVETPTGTVTHIFSVRAPEYRLVREVPLAAQLGEYVVFGVIHIFTGYDHMLFLVGLLLAALSIAAPFWQRVRGVLIIVTAFTLAHSMTLVGAALGWLRLPSRLVESAIAASLVYVGLENMLVRQPRGRWLLTFGFGLIHGFGFASVLEELGLPTRGLVASLFAFNVGVELGQATIVLLALPLLIGLGRVMGSRWPGLSRRLGGPERPLVVLGSVPVVLFGLFWLFERATNIKLWG
jgi:hydrogenase/urease accessory protein HupE